MRSLAIASSLVLAHSVCAETITFSTPYYVASGPGNISFNGGETSDGTLQLNSFNPALGTLNSVTVSFTANYSLYSPIGSTRTVAFTILGPDRGQLINISNSGETIGSYGPFAGSTTLTSMLGPYTGTGPLTFTVQPRVNGSGSDTSVITQSGSALSVTYAYTPAPTALTPEPSSLLLLSSGIIGVGAAVRRRMF